jgi:serine/threonine protein kinase/tetratricopeptide (TPR) repeat protein
MSLEPGTRLGPYEIVELRGKGGMGEVYLGRDTRLGRDVALKVLPAELSDDDGFRQRFEREAKTISRLQHPHVCTLHDVGSQDGVEYLVLEYLEGETLADRIARGPLPMEETLRIGREVAEAVAAAHDEGLVHRDLKPGNVMLTKTGAKVLDFGLARGAVASGAGVDTQAATAAAVTERGSIVGTMPYMAPEQLEGRPADARSDIWALGCLLYECATGERPFAGDTQASLIGAIMNASPEPPSRKHALTPARLDHVVARCIEKDPHRRWQSARDVALEIEALGRVAEESVGPSARPKVPRSVVAVAAVSALALAVWFALRSGSPPVQESFGDKIAAFPFADYTSDGSLEQLSTGIPEQVLARFSGIHPTVSQAASFGRVGDEPCGATLDLEGRFALEGSLRRTGNRVQASARLTDCSSALRIWNDSYEGAADDPFAFQTEVAERLRAGVWEAVVRQGQLDEGTFNYYFLRRTEADNDRALAIAREELERDPQAMDWYNAMTHALLQRIIEGWGDGESAVREVERVADECLALDPAKWWCQMAAGVAARFGGDPERMVSSYRNMAEIVDSDNPLPSVLVISGAEEEAVEIAERNLAQNPEHKDVPDWYVSLAYAHFAASNYPEALEAATAGLAVNENTRWNADASSHAVAAASAAWLGDLEAARSHLEEARRLRPALSEEHTRRIFAAATPDFLERYLEGLRRAEGGGLSTGSAALPYDQYPFLTPVAVLPFVGPTGDSDLANLGAAIAEEVSGLYGVDRPAVPSSTALRQRGKSACAAAAAMNVDLVVEGTLTRLGDTMRTRARVVLCPVSRVVWDEGFDLAFADPAVLVDRAASEIVEAMSPTVWALQDRAHRASGGPGNPWWHFFQRSETHNAEAQAIFAQALEDHPDLVTHQVSAVHPKVQALVHGWGDAERLVTEMQELAERCLELDDRHGECQRIAGMASNYAGDQRAAVKALRRCVDISRRDSRCLSQLARALVLAGETEEALASLDEVFERSPDDPFVASWWRLRALALFADGRFDESRDAALEGLALNTNDAYNSAGWLQVALGASLARLGNQQGAQEALAEASELLPRLSPELVRAVFAGDSSLAEGLIGGLQSAGLS